MAVTWSALYLRADAFSSKKLNAALGFIHLDTDTKHAVWDGTAWYSDSEWQTTHQHQFLDACRVLFELENG